jgi:UDP-N-acetylmuramate: L-alanyl-gamma-D-glutamyl-meso-diaminopimelate ligase
MQIHILGICGTFMGSMALLAKEYGLSVSGQDATVYPPMSTQLEQHGIKITDGYDIADIPAGVDLFVIGNVMRRGMPIIEYLLDNKLPYMSGPEFLAKYVLRDRHILVVTGTHGKTTTSSILAWILQYAGLEPGYLIGGVPNNFAKSAALGNGKYFVLEGDEYDCAFFDKRSKFLHYSPQTLIINNIEFDHADIFADLKAIITQFHHLLRIVPSNGLIVCRADDENIQHLLQLGKWTPCESFGVHNADWTLTKLGTDPLPDSLLGEHNKLNALAAMAAANHVGVDPATTRQALLEFTGVKRRMEIKGVTNGITIYSDFAHHPTAIQLTIAALRQLIGPDARIIAVVDICSNTMKAGVHQASLTTSVAEAQAVFFYHATNITWDLYKVWHETHKYGGVFQDKSQLAQALIQYSKPGDYILLMSNGAFESVAQDLMLTGVSV